MSVSNTTKLVTVERLNDDGDTTLGIITVATYNNAGSLISNQFYGFTLEDQFNPIANKVKGETRPPAGRYALGVRTVGGFNKRHQESKHFASTHKGMLQVGVVGHDNGSNREGNVPGFSYILVHTGNDSSHTEGCLLVGNSATMSPGNDSIGDSRNAYLKVYMDVIEWALAGRAWIQYIDRDRGAHVIYTDYSKDAESGHHTAINPSQAPGL